MSSRITKTTENGRYGRGITTTIEYRLGRVISSDLGKALERLVKERVNQKAWVQCTGEAMVLGYEGDDQETDHQLMETVSRVLLEAFAWYDIASVAATDALGYSVRDNQHGLHALRCEVGQLRWVVDQLKAGLDDLALRVKEGEEQTRGNGHRALRELLAERLGFFLPVPR